MYLLALSECQMLLWPVMGMLDRISEHAVTICMLCSYRWSYNASKSYSHTHTLVHTDQGNLWLGLPVQYSSEDLRLQAHAIWRREANGSCLVCMQRLLGF